jgi:heme-degrading monooxygenase HmoA
MYVKWIVCDIKKNFERDFSLAQEQWIATQEAVGFIGQVGGWDSESKKTACIISFWENENSLKLFMENTHDKIFFNNNQSEYYTSINVDHFNSLWEMKGNSNAFIDVLNKIKLLRIEDYIVIQEKSKHFEMVRENSCFSELKKAKGMFGCKILKAVNDVSRYLVSSFWDSIESYDNYLEQKISLHEVTTDAQDDINQVFIRQIILVDSWKIIKKITNI